MGIKEEKLTRFSIGVWTILLGTLLPFVVTSEVPNNQREGKVLSYRHNTEDLNIEHIISLWNKSVTEEPSPIAETTTTTLHATMPQKILRKKDKATFPNSQLNGNLPENFPERFSYCIKKQKFSMKVQPEQGIIMKCLKDELIAKLHSLLSNPSDNIKLFNGYLEFQKLENQQREKVQENEILKNESDPNLTKKKYSSRVSSKKPLEPEGGSSQPFVPVALKQPKASHSHSNDYYEAYQKMLRELVARKNGAEVVREKREGRMNKAGPLEKSAKLFARGRKLFTEITNNLENKEEEVETLTQTILDPELVSSINNFTRAYSLRLNFYPGISARMKRNENSGVTFDLELDDLNEGEDESEEEDAGARDDLKKKKKKVSKKTLKKLFPYLLIPFMIQAALLPIVLKFLLFVAIKALIAGKLALILVAFNAIRNASLKSDEDEYVERMSYEHYGYGNGEEYGAWVNRRELAVPEGEDNREGIAEEEYADPYQAYRPQLKQ